jgi:hypothetical protein
MVSLNKFWLKKEAILKPGGCNPFTLKGGTAYQEFIISLDFLFKILGSHNFEIVLN